MVIYQQYDGYPNGVAKWLIDFIKSKKMVKGYSNRDIQFNGFECLFAQYISRFKSGAGGLYIYPPNANMNEEYNYILTYNTDTHEFTLGMNNKGPTHIAR
jgi:hypothetical protein